MDLKLLIPGHQHQLSQTPGGVHLPSPAPMALQVLGISGRWERCPGYMNAECEQLISWVLGRRESSKAWWLLSKTSGPHNSWRL